MKFFKIWLCENYECKASPVFSKSEQNTPLDTKLLRMSSFISVLDRVLSNDLRGSKKPCQTELIIQEEAEHG